MPFLCIPYSSFLEIPFLLFGGKGSGRTHLLGICESLLLIPFGICFYFMVLEMELRTLSMPGQHPVLEPSLHVSES